MARIRSIHPDAHQSEKLAALTSDAERLYWRLQGHCDDEGRCEDNPRLIWGMTSSLIATWTHLTVHELLQELHDAGLIRRYIVENRGCIQVVKWADYQHPQRPKKSPLPPLPELSPKDRGHVRDAALTDQGDACAGGERRQPRAGSSYASPVDNPLDGKSPVAVAAARALDARMPA